MPTSPSTRVSTPDLGKLHDWWDYWKQQLVIHFQRYNTSAPLFLVASLLSTPQYAVCFTENHSLDTKLNISGAESVTSAEGVVKVRASPSCTIVETGSAFDFDNGAFDQDNPWVVFVNDLRADIFGPMTRFKELFVRLLL